MRERTFATDGLHLSALQGINEARSEAYIRYGDRALELITSGSPSREDSTWGGWQQSLKILGGLRAPHASRTRRCKSL